MEEIFPNTDTLLKKLHLIFEIVLVMQFQMPTADSSKKIVFSPFSPKRPPQR